MVPLLAFFDIFQYSGSRARLDSVRPGLGWGEARGRAHLAFPVTGRVPRGPLTRDRRSGKERHRGNVQAMGSVPRASLLRTQALCPPTMSSPSSRRASLGEAFSHSPLRLLACRWSTGHVSSPTSLASDLTQTVGSGAHQGGVATTEARGTC